jgi:putative ABC transport system permease protein
MHVFWQDVRYALRMLRKTPGFTVVAIITLALGIGATTAIFTIVNAVLLRSLPYRQSNTLVKVWGKFDKMGIPRNWISEPEWWDLQAANKSFSELAAYSGGGGANMVINGAQPMRVSQAAATSSLFPLLGVRAATGRLFTSEEDDPGKSSVALLSYGLWKNAFGRNPNVVGQKIQLDQQSFIIVGVLPQDFNFDGTNDVWVPLGLDKSRPQSRGGHYLEVIGRLKPGITVTQAAGDVERFAADLARTYPNNYAPNSGFGMFLVPLETDLTGQIRPALLVLMAAVGFVLLIGCVNLANLLLARAAARQREIAVRTALGASKLRIVRQLLTESVVLSATGGVLGLLLAVWAVDVFRGLSNINIPRLGEASIDMYVLGFALAISVLTGMLFGLSPAFHVVGPSLQTALKDSGRTSSYGVGGGRLRANLVASEIALALVLLVGAGLLVRSFQHLLKVDPGFQTEHLLTMRVALPQARYPNGAAPSDFFKKLINNVKALPGVEAAGTVTRLPLSGTYSSGTIRLEDTSVPNALLDRSSNLPHIETDYRWVTPGYFEAMKVPVIKGRLFTDADNIADAPPVAIVDEEFANRFWPGKDPTGKRIAYNAVPNSNPPQPIWRTIVGVVGHVKHYSLDVQGREQAYFPAAQNQFTRAMFIVVRTGTDPAAMTSTLRAQVAALDRELPVFGVETMDELLAQSLTQPQVNMLLLAGFATLALLLAAVGIYGVMSYVVSQRTQEIGVRMALGADRSTILKMIVLHGLRLAGSGLLIGLALALLLTRLMKGLLYATSPNDPLTFIGISLLLAAVAFLASYIPALRATKVDPMVALRYE